MPRLPTSDELLRLIIESSVDFAIITTDPAGTVTSWNAGAERLLGWAEAEIVGRSADLIFAPEDRAALTPATERRLALDNGHAEDERWHVRKDGSRFWGSGSMMPLTDREAGFIKIMRDRTRQHEAVMAMADSERRFRVLATQIPQLVFRSDARGRWTWISPQWAAFAGPGTGARALGWLRAIHRADRRATLQAWRTARSEGRYLIEHRIRRAADGQYRWHQTRAVPLDAADPQHSDWVGTSSDIHAIRALQDRQKTLLAELQHRTRNLLAIIQAITRQSLRTSPSIEAFAAEFEGRLQTLSRVLSLLARPETGGVGLRELLQAEIAAHGSFPPGKIRLEGPDVELPSAAIQALALALHELATNALKYGALGQAAGRLAVTWNREPEGRVALDWQESGVAMPVSADPPRRGFGTEIILRALPYEHGADTSLDFGPEGLHCHIALAF